MSAETDQRLAAWNRGDTELRDLLAIDAEYWEALRGRAQYYLQEGENERALIMLEMLAELDRRDPMPRILAADLLLQDGRSEAATEHVSAILATHPDHPEARVTLAEISIASGDLEAAARQLESVVDRDPNCQTPAGIRARSVAGRAHARIVASSAAGPVPNPRALL